MYFTTLHCPTITIPVFPMSKHVRMISVSPSTDLSALEARQVACALCIVEAESVWIIQAHIDVHGRVASTDAPDPVSAADAKLHSTVDTR